MAMKQHTVFTRRDVYKKHEDMWLDFCSYMAWVDQCIFVGFPFFLLCPTFFKLWSETFVGNLLYLFSIFKKKKHFGD